ncbi:cytochrome c-type biogenesis protein CcsB [Thermodesulfatator indicus DSM 15286]|uniref:Cytochrome c-type biogenesis protein CcsB n=1 Tax=Thermodesulfatator indicus (strain DSM 15286 / JCM 11887 / CIR29812) TaxID=667014 RepID=F8A9P6_THEID|nr:c-type cytochrome biogenesis protein CcsB [Thermodesulfatator indicus]AEH45281.1 cytochrome c-type biogenesis protein CcsB [Thermodesulfatator indicus DSM 15286]
MNILFFKLALIIYAISTVGFFIYAYTQKNEAAKGALYTLILGFTFHTLSIILRWFESGHPPITSLFEATSFTSWGVVLAYLVVIRKIKQAKILGAMVTPIATLLMLYSSLCPKEILPLPPVLKSLWLPIHAAISIISYGFFILAAASGVLYLIQERQIKKKKLGGWFKRLPSLDTLDRVNELSLKIGFPLLTIGIITGAAWAEKAWGDYWSWDPKETWSLIMWLIYAALIHERLVVGWRGRKSAWLSIIGFGAWLISFFVINLYISGHHSYVR